MKCPMCGKSEVVRVGPWQAFDGMFGIGFITVPNKVCCSIPNNFRGTREEAEALAHTKSLERWAAEESLEWTEEEATDW